MRNGTPDSPARGVTNLAASFKTEKFKADFGNTKKEEDEGELLGVMSNINVKPFYGTELENEESLIALIRYKKMVLFNIGKIMKKYLGR